LEEVLKADQHEMRSECFYFTSEPIILVL